MTKKKIAWIIPIFNEEQTIPTLVKTLDELGRSVISKYDTEFIFVDDGSKDKSLSMLEEMFEKRKNYKVISFSRNFGHQAAITAGLDIARADAYIFMDADMQDPPEVSLELIKKWEEGFDVAYAKRRTRQDSFMKKFTAHWFYRLLNQFSDVEIPEDTGDFRLITDQVAQVLRQLKEKHRFIRGLVSFVGFNQTAVLFDRHERLAGKTGYSLKKMLKLASDGLTGFSLSPISMIGTVGGVFTTIGVFGAIFSYFVNCWVFLIVFAMAFFAGIILLALSVIGQYVGKTFQEAQGRPLYIVKEKLEH